MDELKLDLAKIANEGVSDEYISCAHNNEKEIVVNKNAKIKKNITKALYALGGAAILSASIFAINQHKGATKLALDMKQVAEEQNYQIFVDSHDPSIRTVLVNGKATDMDKALNDIVNNARKEGFNDYQIYIGLDTCCPSLEVGKIINKPTLSESIATKNNAYLDYEKEKGATK